MKRSGRIVDLKFRHSPLSLVGVEVTTLTRVRARAAAILEASQRPDFLQLLMVERGSGLHTIDFVEHELSAGTLMIVRPGQVQQWHDRPGIQGTLLIVSDVVLPSALADGAGDPDLLALDDWPAVSRPESDRWLAVLDDVKRLSADIARFDGGELDAAIVRHVLLALLLRLARDLVGTVTSGGQETQIYRLFRRELEASFLDRRGVQHYVARLGYSRSTLSRACMASTGLTAKQLVDRRTVLGAKRLLAHSEATTAEIAHRLGFSEPTNFVKFFRRLAGTVPGAFRARNATATRSTME